VQAVWVTFTEDRGWHGGTDRLPGATEHLPLPDRIMFWTAGKAAEELFDCPAHTRAWLGDAGEIDTLLDREGLAHEREQRIAEGKTRARAILNRERDNAQRLFDLLVEHGHIEREAFERLMQGHA
jgi:hypothetical protein